MSLHGMYNEKQVATLEETEMVQGILNWCLCCKTVLLLASGKSGVREWENVYPNTELPKFLHVTLLAKVLACYIKCKSISC